MVRRLPVKEECVGSIPTAAAAMEIALPGIQCWYWSHSLKVDDAGSIPASATGSGRFRGIQCWDCCHSLKVEAAGSIPAPGTLECGLRIRIAELKMADCDSAFRTSAFRNRWPRMLQWRSRRLLTGRGRVRSPGGALAVRPSVKLTR